MSFDQQRTKRNLTTSQSILTNVSSTNDEDDEVLERMKQTAQKTYGLVVNMGISWYKAFEKEFSKPYFLNVGL